MRGMRAHALLDGAEFIQKAKTASVYRLVIYSTYPGLVSGEHAIEGEIYRVSFECLTRLDEYEGAPDEYRRHPVELQGVDMLGTVDAYFLCDHRAEHATAYAHSRWVES